MTIKSKVKSKVNSKSKLVIKPKSNLVKNSLITTGILGSLATVGLLVNNKMKKAKSTEIKVESEKELSGYKKIIDMLTKKIQDQEVNHKKQFEMLNNKLQDQEANIKKLQVDNLDRINILTKTIEMLGEVNKKNDKKYNDLNENHEKLTKNITLLENELQRYHNVDLGYRIFLG